MKGTRLLRTVSLRYPGYRCERGSGGSRGHGARKPPFPENFSKLIGKYIPRHPLCLSNSCIDPPLLPHSVTVVMEMFEIIFVCFRNMNVNAVLLVALCCMHAVSCLLEGAGETPDDTLHRIQMLEQMNNLQNQQIDTQDQKITSLVNSLNKLQTQYVTDVQNLQNANSALNARLGTLKKIPSNLY